MDAKSTETFFREYTSPDVTLKYTRATAGFGISYLLDHDYKAVYAKAIGLLPENIRRRGIRILEFGCGGGMNLLHVLSVLDKGSIRVERAIGTDFSPVLIEAAKHEARNYLQDNEQHRVEFYLAKNESLIDDLANATGAQKTELTNSFHFIFGVNTIRYCHRVNKELDCAQEISNLLVPGGVCVVIDMNNRYPIFRSSMKNIFRKQKQEECYLPTLEEYTEPFTKAGFAVRRTEHFCWVPHSSGHFLCRLLVALSPILNRIAKTRAMRSLVVSQKQATAIANSNSL